MHIKSIPTFSLLRKSGKKSIWKVKSLYKEGFGV